ncbi:signal peptidase II, Aspartic peptidase, MEROPS family A08 [Novosphingobium aromaticivorans DSM 12444]|uniref:Lipoprotein signal peptidase n=1 Tax=Novosphingobium aromaticivorans (strain ATCC 700278 / DSM 12444 / CCUG 56034 / CIP 105152 / NBRC 16084 / F199) TaxID=279238 RepID=Q2G380_NOVAD|nr:signal peptidase II [Novosphingobium aromaticivorans]ABD27693.1 signal peptidase II, Aspartic peptidase, MEROPS family A08 [Novosphingobium aromaticivorans DSM 12444]SCY30242.1 signal peptidase II Aspartic peptidase. MEROPS family A08 [Novosphingobium aromaticivorans]
MLARPRIEGLGLAVLVALVDRAVKALMVGPLMLRERGVIDLVPMFDLRYAENFGVSFGMFTATSPEMRWGLIGVTAVIAAGVLVWMLRETARGDILGLGLVLGGALGNIYDRLVYGYVIDYADLHIGEWRPFQIFNLADVAITFGVLILLARSFKSREKRNDGDDTATENA